MKRKYAVVAALPLVALSAAVFLLGQRRSTQIDSGRRAGKKLLNILLITLDTTRPDRIGAYGYPQARTPALDALAAEGTRFSRAQSPVPLTLPAHASILTGTYPTYHGIRNNGSYFLPPQAETLAEILKKRGYMTAAFVSSFILDSRFGLDQGFEVYSDRMNTGGGIKDLQSERSAAEVFPDFDTWLASVDSSRLFFCWVHFYDPHLPYTPPEPFKSDSALSPYDGEIANVDLYVGRVLEGLRRRGLYDNTLIVVAGDHGEAFGEHEETGHGIFCYQESLAVPLIVRMPGRRPGVINDVCDLADIMPTVLEAVGENIPSYIQGLSLLPLIAGKRGKEREFYFESLYGKESLGAAPLTGLLISDWKYIDLPRPECYYLTADPGEKNNLVQQEGARAERIKSRLQEWQAQSRRQNIDTAHAISAEERRRLESLGYIASGSARPEGKGLPDPKDLIAGWSEHVTGKSFLEAGDLERAEKHLLRAIELNPIFFNPYIDLSRLRLGRGDIQGGLSILKRGIERNPGDAAVKIEYARALAEADRAEEALVVLREAEKQMVFGQHETIQVMIGTALSWLGRFAEAADAFRRALDIEPENLVTARELAYCLYRAGLFAEAMSFYKRAENGLPEDPLIPGELALCYAALQDYAAAAASFEKAIRLGPSQEVYFNYALMTAKTGDLKKAADLMNLSLKQNPLNPRLADQALALLQEWKKRLSL